MTALASQPTTDGPEHEVDDLRVWLRLFCRVMRRALMMVAEWLKNNPVP